MAGLLANALHVDILATGVVRFHISITDGNLFQLLFTAELGARSSRPPHPPPPPQNINDCIQEKYDVNPV